MADTLTNVFGGFIDFIMGIIQYITDLVAYFRAQNDGKEDVELPELPFFKDNEAEGE